ncbi:MAG: 16S rRNA (cytosine(1402)-N(4))-methyltransferase RsmH [Acidibacillus sp.]|uniref:Ribosomal RNA small subunit methyltransferase H n=1 Tax=Sulfoacidibacillus ferrooxidans TaxID=2005001 RepID=A0A9X2AC16_9BACL|nr:16S rRNA (cytosine(1402)-N(4))-methyltransferase RsmH [Sulfoacidibacillus ferrooxidans]MCI0181780.1 Ribosomal RNA small subunit methyltransferase H [Sulfoacidibacillus ferrooxidans]MCY0892921.1 16S rRNA (cytosine(1402)-N(4))-methyltransferase RsmH [Acidibacillus sp.]
MSIEGFVHHTVLLSEAVDMLNPRSGGIYVDGTMGGGGHTRALLEASAPLGRVIAFDQDLEAVTNAETWREGYHDRLIVVHDNFRMIGNHLQRLAIPKVQGILCDLGVSSPQLDDAWRGFSYQQDAPLDMRMDHRQTVTAKKLVNTCSERELADYFFEYGEERWGKRIAQFIVASRKVAPIETTEQLVAIIKAAIPAAARKDGPHPAKRVFQALRIAVNEEMTSLQDLLVTIPQLLDSYGRAAFITFHSLEDRIVKKALIDAAKDCICPPDFPQCICDHRATMQVITRKPVVPSDVDIELNPRARSAKLRVAERLPN